MRDASIHAYTSVLWMASLVEQSIDGCRSPMNVRWGITYMSATNRTCPIIVNRSHTWVLDEIVCGEPREVKPRRGFGYTVTAFIWGYLYRYNSGSMLNPMSAPRWVCSVLLSILATPLWHGPFTPTLIQFSIVPSLRELSWSGSFNFVRNQPEWILTHFGAQGSVASWRVWRVWAYDSCPQSALC